MLSSIALEHLDISIVVLVLLHSGLNLKPDYLALILEKKDA
jgi:predicted RNA binding protein YcfA (HicA-like mRNA interferase family)